MRRWSWLALLAGCTFHHGELGNGDGSGGDRPIDTPGGSADAQQCFSVSQLGVNVCLTAPPTGTTSVTSNTSIDTNMVGSNPLQCKQLQISSTPGLCVIAAATITIDATRVLSARGNAPLVLVATTININGTIDVASHTGPAQRGPGANAAGCNAGTNPVASGGGQGGSFGSEGGAGGDQDNQSSSGGLAGAALVPTTLRGGCAGARGGGNGGNGGDGGGAVLLIATTINFGQDGAINASGGYGRGASTNDKGGGGAGSGGMIALSAMTIVVGTNTQIFANGAGGGGGSDNNNGQNGSEPTSASSTNSGGAGDNGGDGGDGFPASSRDGFDGAGGNNGGGGGGGGAGIIHNYSSSLLGSNVSPPAS